MIVFKKELFSWTNDLETTIKYTVHNDLNLDELMQEFRRILLAVGYQSDNIDKYIERE